MSSARTHVINCSIAESGTDIAVETGVEENGAAEISRAGYYFVDFQGVQVFDFVGDEVLRVR